MLLRQKTWTKVTINAVPLERKRRLVLKSPRGRSFTGTCLFPALFALITLLQSASQNLILPSLYRLHDLRGSIPVWYQKC
jgi:hypothetical protein